ncbi:MAG TPA: prepilin-type N-terminal cleavage/methylation domain-containing protein [Anaerolineae bacterium]|nr:prepilin-type N-terminal cleavage/methylation domain-containing protein [Anaerolineae bacterium]
MCRLCDSNNGFTLMEVLFAMLILTVGLLGTAALITGVINSNKLSNRISTATILAQDKMEEIRGVGYAGADAEAGTEGYNIIPNYLLYKRITAVVAGDPAAGMKKITVTVYWDSDAHSVVLNTILAE